MTTTYNFWTYERKMVCANDLRFVFERNRITKLVELFYLLLHYYIYLYVLRVLIYIVQYFIIIIYS